MKRKTNLFYNSNSQDSNFLTFSNYTESMTGNFLATDNKLYPSSFLCLNIPRLYNKDYALEEYNNIIKENQEYTNKLLDDAIILDNMSFYVIKGNITIGTATYHKSNNVSIYGEKIPNNIIKEYVTEELISLIKNAIIAKLSNNNDFTWLSTISNIDVISIYDKNDSIIVTSNTEKEEYNVLGIKLNTLDFDTLPEYKEMNDSDNLSDTDIYQYNKKEFMLTYLCAHYENKLAYLRDYYTNNDKLVESSLLPLNYLLETIYNYDSSSTIEYVGDVTEQDYNGTFTDTICVVDTSKYYKGSIIEQSASTNRISVYKESNTYLYGWSSRKQDYNPNYDFNKDGEISLSISTTSNNNLFLNNPDYLEIKSALRSSYNIQDDTNDDYNTYILNYTSNITYNNDKDNYLKTLNNIITYAKISDQYNGPSLYKDVKPVYDGYDSDTYTYYYNISSDLYNISLEEVPLVSNTTDAITELSFNVIIPLYDMVDNNYNTNNRIISELGYIPLHNQSTTSLENQEMYVQYVPLGIWFSGINCVTIKRDHISQYSSTWSLCLSSQFKPFPYSTYMPSEITNTSKSDAYLTFAQILTKQNDLIDTMSNLNLNLIDMSQRLNVIEKKISSLGTTYNMDKFELEINDFKTYINNQITNLRNEINENQLRWVNKEA